MYYTTAPARFQISFQDMATIGRCIRMANGKKEINDKNDIT